MAEPSLPDRCKNALIVKSTLLTSDKTLNSFGATLTKLKGELTQSDCSYTNTAQTKGKAKPISDAVANPYDSYVYTPKPLSNSKKFDKFRKDWGSKAVESKLIPPMYFDSYTSILSVPNVSDNISKGGFKEQIDILAYMIKLWYVNAQYAGDMSELSFAIDNDKPEWTPPEDLKDAATGVAANLAASFFGKKEMFCGGAGCGSCGGRCKCRYCRMRGLTNCQDCPYCRQHQTIRWPLKEAAIFGTIVGIGLVGICFWKASK